MKASNLRTGMKVKMMGKSSIIEVLTTCPHNCDTGNNFWFKGRITDLKGSNQSKYNYVGYESDFNVDFAVSS